jgi:hypothetical protein
MRTRTIWLFPAVGILFTSHSLQAVPVHQWSKSLGSGESIGNSVAMDGSGNVIVTGHVEGDFFYERGMFFLEKLAPDGAPLWSRSLGDGSGQFGRSVAADGSGNVIVTGDLRGTIDFGGGPFTSEGSIFVVKFDADGNHLWSQHFESADGGGRATSVAADDSGNIIVTGWFYGTVDFGGGPLTFGGIVDIFVVKFDANGHHIWSRQFGAPSGAGRGYSVATDGLGNIVVTGPFGGIVDFGGGPLQSAGNADIFVAKFDANGSHSWSQRFGDSNNQGEFGMSIAADGSGNVIITGDIQGTADFGGGPLTSVTGIDIVVVKFGANGNHIWSRRFGNTGSQFSTSVAAGGSGNVVVTGRFTGTVDFGGGALTTESGNDDIFVASFDVYGNHIWSRRFGETQTDGGQSVDADASGNVVMTGYFAGPADFGGGIIWSSSPFGIFVVKFMEGPLPVRITNFEARTREGAIEIIWDVWSDEALESFALYRSDDAHPQAIVIAEGPLEASTRSRIDSNVEPGKTYHYELLIRTQDGEDLRSPIASATVPRFESTLGQNFPNPFKPATTIEYTLSEQSSAVLGIYDAAGRLVVRLDQGVRDAGIHRAEWDGRDGNGKAVGSGVYFYRIEGAPRVAAKKMVLVR